MVNGGAVGHSRGRWCRAQGLEVHGVQRMTGGEALRDEVNVGR